MDQPEDSFLSHLFELRDRLIRALVSIGIVFVCLFPWAKELYALLAQPLHVGAPLLGRQRQHLLAQLGRQVVKRAGVKLD